MGNKEKFYVDIMAENNEVTGSRIPVIVKLPDGQTIRFLVDCGLFQEKQYAKQNSSLSFNPERFSFCLITHSHTDHTGALPLLFKKGFSGKIFTTEGTSKLLPLSLKDSLKILKISSKRLHTKCMYDERDLEHAIASLIPCNFDKPIQVHQNVTVTFLRNGHSIGSSLILVQVKYPGYEDINLLFTGDFNKKNIFVDVNPIPQWILDLPITIIQESTYGDVNSTETTCCFKKNLLTQVENEGSVIVPAFSLGRSQEVLYTLKSMQNERLLSCDVPIFLDGKLAIQYTNLIQKDELGIKEEMRDFLPENLTLVNKQNRMPVIAKPDPKIIITTSGMGSFGPAQVYIPEFIKRKKALIQFTGYTAPGTLGSKIKNADPGSTVEIGGVLRKKNAWVSYTTEFSSHAKADELIDFLNQFKKIKLILVNHGEKSVKEIFANRIVKEVNAKDVGILGRDYVFRVCPYGFVKTFPSKFE